GMVEAHVDLVAIGRVAERLDIVVCPGAVGSGVERKDFRGDGTQALTGDPVISERHSASGTDVQRIVDRWQAAEVSCPLRVGWDNKSRRFASPLPKSLIVEEPERLVPAVVDMRHVDRRAGGKAELITAKRILAGHKRIAGIEDIVPDELEHR